MKSILFKTLFILLPILSYGQATLIDKSQISASGATTNQILKWNGTAWVFANEGGGVSGTVNTIPYFNSSTTLASSGLNWNNTTGRLSLNTTSSLGKIHMIEARSAPTSLTSFLATQTFATTTNWTTGTGWAITGGQAVATNSSDNLTYSGTINFVAGQSYLVTMDISGWTSGTFTVNTGGTTQGFIYPFTKTAFKFVYTPSANSTVFRIQGSSLTANFDNISIETWSSYNEPTILVQDSVFSSSRFPISFPGVSSIALGDNNRHTLGAVNPNISIGNLALSSNTNGNYNIAIGSATLQRFVNGSDNIAIGDEALSSLSSSNRNIAIGRAAMKDSYNGNSNIAIGKNTMLVSNGSKNVVIGNETIRLAGSFVGTGNVIIGDSTANNISGDASNNILIGSNISVPAGSSSNQINIGNILFGLEASGKGTTIAGQIGIGITTPTARLHVKSATSSSSDFALNVINSSDASLLAVQSGGFVGVGTTTPKNKLEVNGSFGRGTMVKTSATTYTVGDNDTYILLSSTSNVTLTLPAASSWTRREIMIRSYGEISVSSASTNIEINGNLVNSILSIAYASCTLVSDGTNWVVVSRGY
jgi:hypothetical protein